MEAAGLKLFDQIREELIANPADADAYERLGGYYLTENIDRAYLCYEMSRFYEPSSEKKQKLTENLDKLRQQGSSVRNVSVVIVSYNSREAQIGCIESIRMNNPKDSYEIVVVDNASSDGIAEWLEAQGDIKLKRNDENIGFGPASNRGVAMACAGNDIFFLNNDTIVLPGSVFWLRMGLYGDDRTGAVGSVSNSVSFFQRVDEDIDTLDGWMAYGLRNNVMAENPYERMPTLVGFAMMVKRPVLDQTGLFDEIFGIGNYEDDDLSLRIRQEGYDLVLCHNSFIYHHGSLGFRQKDDRFYNDLIDRNRRLFINKWGFDIWMYKSPAMDIIEHIGVPENGTKSVLEIGCGCGATLLRIGYEYPGTVVKGIEENADITDVFAPSISIVNRDRDHMFDLGNERFDHIILGDITRKTDDIALILTGLRDNLAENGSFILRLYNIMHVSVILPLLKGSYAIPDDHLYTADSIVEICRRADLKLKKISGTRGYEEILENDNGLWGLLSRELGDDFTAQALTYNYVVSLTKK